MRLHKPFPELVPDDLELDLSPPPSLTMGSLRSLVQNIRDRVAPEKLPPLQLTSRPVDVGMTVGEMVDRPWYRTIFTNIGDVVSPEVLPPLELQSQPLDTGELLGDQLAHPWWASLIRSLADKFAPEQLSPMQLSSAPVNPELASNVLMVPKWSALLESPKIFYPDKPKEARSTTSAARFTAPVVDLELEQDERPDFTDLIRQTKRDVHWAHMREAVWISCAVVEVALIVVFALKS